MCAEHAPHMICSLYICAIHELLILISERMLRRYYCASYEILITWSRDNKVQINRYTLQDLIEYLHPADAALSAEYTP